MGFMKPLTVALPDGRQVAYLDGGDPAGYPVLGLHGTPGCRLNRLPDDTVYARTGVRYITTDRAGYGQSSRHHGRSVADEAADVGARSRRARLGPVLRRWRVWRRARTHWRAPRCWRAGSSASPASPAWPLSVREG